MVPRRLRPLLFALPLLGGLVLLPATPSPASAQGSEAVRAVVAELEPEIRRAMVEGRIPSVTVALTAGGEIVWSGGYGETNLRTRTPATPESVYIIASTLKTMVATVMMQLVEEGHFGLDDPVEPHLGGITLPAVEGREGGGGGGSSPMTLRHLLTHRSGLAGGFSSVPVWADTVPRPLDRFVREGLRRVSLPGEEVRYSNPGFALMAHMVEVATGNDFRDEVRRRIWEPLGMTTTAFAPTPRMEEVLAVPYRPAGGSPDGPQEPVARTRFAEWPAGGAWGTVHDQARWLTAALNGGRAGEVELLPREVMEAMQTRQFDNHTGPMAGGWGGDGAGYGLGWWTATQEGERYIAHSGSVGGYTAFLHGMPDRGLGVAILTNGQRAHPHLVRLSYLATDLMQRHGL